jgi:hypothetical protein
MTAWVWNRGLFPRFKAAVENPDGADYAVSNALLVFLGMSRTSFLPPDATPFVSDADQNPTLPITALGWRTSEYIADQVRELNVKV